MTHKRNITFVDGKKRELLLPDFGGSPIADTHAHLDMLESPVDALIRAAIAGVGLIATLVNVDEDFNNTRTNLEAWQTEAQDYLDEYVSQDTRLRVPEVYMIAGTHPHEASTYTSESEAKIREILDDSRTVGIGEVGLDFFYNHSPQEVQREVFVRQLELAIEMNKVVCLHIRDAHDAAFEILKAVGTPKAGIILHCFNLGPEILAKFDEFDPYVSFAGPLTFKKADDVRESAALVPSHRFLTETDCPFMAPEPLRGQKCEPGFVAFTAARFAEVKGIELPEFARMSYANARACFGLDD